ncbi:hypothetical protein GCM10010191_64400 [Actinomadura vinacea]|uniref:Uncharacterized protein n=1 Tax=Actinomadura vinacea TaxID=115336 RepID=A0ABN3JWG2_9ACTN
MNSNPPRTSAPALQRANTPRPAHGPAGRRSRRTVACTAAPASMGMNFWTRQAVVAAYKSGLIAPRTDPG